MSKRTTKLFVPLLLMLGLRVWAVDMVVTPGLGGKCRPGKWTPITVKLKNPSNENISGNLALIDESTDQPSPRQLPISLPGRSEKQYTYYVPFRYSGDAVIRLISDQRVTENGKPLEAKQSVETLSEQSYYVAVIGEQKYTLNYLSGVKIKHPANFNPSPAKGPAGVPAGVVYPQINLTTAIIDPTIMPDRPQGYDAAQTVVISNLAPNQADPKQLAALKMWVASGGILVVNGGPNSQLFQNDFYSDILPVEVTGTTELPGMGSLSSEFHKPIQSGAVSITSSRLKKNATSIVSANGNPLISSWSYGFGCVYFMAFDYSGFPLKGWDGQIDMWKSMIAAANVGRPWYAPMENGNQNGYYGNTTSSLWSQTAAAMESQLQDTESIAPPPLEMVLLFLIAYLIILVPINYYVLNRKKRKELAWITTPAIIAIFSIGAYGMGYTMKGGKLHFRSITLVEASEGERFAPASSYVSIFSPSRRNYNIKISDPYALVSEADQNFRDQEQVRNMSILQDEVTTLPDMHMDMWSMKGLRISSGCNLGGALTTDLTIVKSRVTGTIRNDSNYMLKNCTIIVCGQFADIGNINAKSEVKIDAKTVASSGSTNSLSVNVKKNIITDLKTNSCDAIIGRFDKSPTDIEMDGRNAGDESVNYLVCSIYVPYKLTPSKPAQGGKP